MVKDKRKEFWSILLLSLSVMVLISVLGMTLYWVYGFQLLIHENNMEELELEKEIALINKGDNLTTVNKVVVQDSNILTELEQLRKAHNCGDSIYYSTYGKEPRLWCQTRVCNDDGYCKEDRPTILTSSEFK